MCETENYENYTQVATQNEKETIAVKAPPVENDTSMCVACDVQNLGGMINFEYID